MHPFLITIGWFRLPTYGTLLTLGIIGGIFVAIRLGRRVGVASGQILDFISWVILISLVGAKVLMILTLWGYYRNHLDQIFSVATLKLGGAFYGGFLAALIFTVWYARVEKISFWKFADVMSPSVALGTTVARLGCFNAGCDYGKPTTAPWGVIFTNTFAHEASGVPLGVRLHPTQLYESATTLAIFGVLLWWFPGENTRGMFSSATWACTPWVDFCWNFCGATKTGGSCFTTCFRHPSSSPCWCWQGSPQC